MPDPYRIMDIKLKDRLRKRKFLYNQVIDDKK